MWEEYKNERISTDMDGVLCKDKEPLIPLNLPPYPIEDIITGRNERYRKTTETWLAKYKIEYKNLYMLDIESYDWQIIAKFKIKIFNNSNANIFIESDKKQAEYIASCALKGKIFTFSQEGDLILIR